MAEVVIYSSDYCPYCMRAKQLLKKKGVSYTEHVVDGNPSLRQEMTSKAGSHTVPQIWIDDQHIGGCDDLYALERSNRLDPLLK